MVWLGWVWVGCGRDVEGACAAAVDAQVACIETAFEQNEADRATLVAQAQGTCGDYLGLNDKDTEELLLCWADVWAAADCTDPEAYGASADSLADCG